MNRLKVRDNLGAMFLGGMPVDLEDFDWMDKSVRDAFYGLMSALGITPETSFIISGCAVASGSYAAGWICLNGEILPVDGGVVPTPSGGQIIYWDVEVSFDSGGSEAFENGITHDTYEIRKGKLVAGAAPAHYMPFAAPTIWDRLAIGLGHRIIDRGKIIKEFKTATGVLVATTAVPVILPFVPTNAGNCGKLTVLFTCNYTASNAAVVDLMFRIKVGGVIVKTFLECSVSNIGGARNFAMMWMGGYTAGQTVEVECECANLNLTVNEGTCLVEGLID
jgi:hypothetical protein